MDQAEGDLSNIIENQHGKQVELKRFFEIFRDSILGVVYMHKRHLVHRDIKPQNVLVMDEKTYVISDYGEGMNLHFEAKYSKETNYAIGTHTMAGTIPYIKRKKC